MNKTIYETDKLKVRYEPEKASMGQGVCYLYYNKYRLPLSTMNELTTEQAEQLIKLIAPALDRLHLVTHADGFHEGEEHGIKTMQKNIKKLLGVK